MVVDLDEIRATVYKNFDIVGPITVHDNGVVDVKHHAMLLKHLPKMPVQFGTVGGNFTCEDCDLQTLWGSPHTVGGEYNCLGNNITDLEYSPVNAQTLVCGGGDLPSLAGLSEHIPSVVVKYSSHIPLLRLLNHEDITVYTDPHGEILEPVQNILDKYKAVGNGKKNAIACAAELIRAGYKGNARW
jgi:hypothetical protein